MYVYIHTNDIWIPQFQSPTKNPHQTTPKKQQPLWDVPTCKPVSCTATIAFIVREGSSRSKARRLYLGPTTGGTQKHSCKCCWRQDERLSFFVTLFVDFCCTLLFFGGEGEGPSLFFVHPWFLKKKKKYLKIRKKTSFSHPSIRKKAQVLH